ncbi:MAG: hypothetical protein KKE44_22800 [Proteobacteria bacterium]|nr:hypothetical protein [Pseudomonadota bacterium]MBU1585563.1 hypothetical protein [Pseudomonadota bacterium]MBU2452975.1 hypothetical protein [Pseudomonadota bacterium]
MKTIKILLWLIILGLLSTLVYQNLAYFMTTVALTLDLKVSSWHWTIPELQNIAFFGICFFLGLFIAGVKGFAVKLRLNKAVKTKDAVITSLKEQVNTLKTELEVFQHDPYIKKDLEEKTIAEPNETSLQKGDVSDSAD